MSPAPTTPLKTMEVGKHAPPMGETPAIVLCNPKYPRNVGTIVRTASCFGVSQVWFTGTRVSLTPHKGYRLPREERMKGYKDVELRQYDKPLDQFPRGAVPIGVELIPGAEMLHEFEHPEHAVYVFGPEDGGLDSAIKARCHRFVVIPTRHCLNLAMAVNIVMYDRLVKRHATGAAPIPSMDDLLRGDRVALRDLENTDEHGLEGIH